LNSWKIIEFKTFNTYIRTNPDYISLPATEVGAGSIAAGDIHSSGYYQRISRACFSKVREEKIGIFIGGNTLIKACRGRNPPQKGYVCETGRFKMRRTHMEGFETRFQIQTLNPVSNVRRSGMSEAHLPQNFEMAYKHQSLSRTESTAKGLCM
jgi:hypothetical protein